MDVASEPVTKEAAIGPQLRAARKLKGVQTRQDLAGMIGRAGFGERVIGQIERGERNARDYELTWLAEALDMTVDQLTRTPGPEPSMTDRLDALEKRVTGQLAAHAQEVEAQLVRQTVTLEEMRDALAELRRLIATDTKIRDEISDLIDLSRPGIVQGDPRADAPDPKRAPLPNGGAAKKARAHAAKPRPR
jgi:transcriptional regulator with XRE-family HTH domain